MSDSKAPYSALATDEKAPLPPAYSPTTLEASAPEFPSSPAAQGQGHDLYAARRRRRAILFSFLTLLTGSVLVATGVGMGAMNGLCGGGRVGGEGRGMMMAPQGNGDERRNWKREVTTIPGEESSSSESHAKYSTHTYSGGNTSYFEYTTRPIVNPGGYTIGTLTGYVHISSKPTAHPSSSATATAEETYPTSPQSRFKREASTIPAEFQPRAVSTKVVYETVTAAPTTTSTTTVWVSAAADERQRAKRAVDEDTEVRFNPDEGKEEWKTSVNRKGETVTLVKTTRPIINPGGQTIGTLDGVYVKPATTTAAPVAGYHTELKKRGTGADDGLVDEE